MITVAENLLRGELLKRALSYLEASLLGRLYSEMQGAHNNKALHKALEQECSELETLIEKIKETIAQLKHMEGTQNENAKRKVHERP